jgi:hypothetical protein
MKDSAPGADGQSGRREESREVEMYRVQQTFCR